MMNRKLSYLVVATAVAVLGCSDDEDDNGTTQTPGPGPSGATTINVELASFYVQPSLDAAPQGDVRFAVTNVGNVMHEFVVVKTELAADQLPVNADGSFNEEGQGVEVVDEIEDIAPGGGTGELILTLDPAHYVLLCNMVMADQYGAVVAHYSEGMFVNFLVTDGITQ